MGSQYSSTPLLHHSILLNRSKLGQRHLRRDIVENHPHGHPHPHFLPRAIDHVADHRYLVIGVVERNMRHDVGYIVLVGRNRYVVHHHERIHRANFAELGPVEFPRITMRAESLGRPAKFSTIMAALRRKLVRFASVPKWLRTRSSRSRWRFCL